MKTCGAIPGGPELDGVDLSKQAVIQGVVLQEGSSDSLPNGAVTTIGYVRLLDSEGEFVAEVPLSARGEFRFFAAPGNWTVRVLTPGRAKQIAVVAAFGKAVDIAISL